MAAFTAADPDDRVVFDGWIARQRATADVALYVVTENGGFAGTAALFSAEGDREVTYWIARHAWGRGVATDALHILVSREPERPLFARVAAHNVASLAVLTKAGFTEVSRDIEFAPGVGREIEEIVLVLVPTLE
jgi:RimJ/RimL family protein N-acetyltransferase